MPGMKKKAETPKRALAGPVGGNGPAPEVLTLGEAAAYLRLPEADVLRLVQQHGLPGRHHGAEWRFLKDAIQDWLRAGTAPMSNKDAWIALAGAWKDDPDLEDALQEIHKQHRQPPSADE
jgi:excisionase family DNA binding protein